MANEPGAQHTMNLANLLTIANLLLLVSGIIGGYIVVRSAISKAESDVQSRVREALSAENELLQARVARLEKENRRVESLMQLLIATLRKTHHIEIEIDGDVITLRSPGGGTHVSRMANP